MLASHNPSYELLNSLTFCVFDLETTGGNHQTDKIIEIGLVKIKNLQVIEHKGFLINPEMHIPDFIQKLTDIKDNDVARSPKIQDVIDEILEFMGDSILVAHNTSFDVPFFNSVLRRLERPEIENKALCTNLMTKYMIPNLLSSNLNYMSNIFGLEHQKAHRALDDALATAHLLLKYLSIFIDKKITKINSLYYPLKKFELDRINFKKDIAQEEIIEKIRSIKIPFVVYFKGAEGVVLYALPIEPNPKQIEYLIEKIKCIPFEMITIKLTGPYAQALIETSFVFSKINKEFEDELVTKLCEFNNIKEEEIRIKNELDMPGDFIILNHLNPEHFVIYPTASFNQKTELVFKYPTHQNKLVQYINSKAQRILTGKLKKDHLKPEIHNILVKYFEAQNDLIIFKAPNKKVEVNDIKDEMDMFINDCGHSYDFPNFYL